jgi:integrase
MASLEIREFPNRTSFRLVFRHLGKQHRHTLSVESERDAKTILASAERTLGLIAEGRVTIPPGADIGLFVATDGRLTHEPTTANTLPLETVFGLYAVDCGYESRRRDKDKPDTDDNLIWSPVGKTANVEPSTLLTIRIHWRHLVRILGRQTPLGSLGFEELQNYIHRRTKQKNRQKNSISPVTIRKEMNTLSGFWTWAVSNKKIKGGFPGKKLKYPASTEAGRFQTWQEIEQQIENGAPENLWDCLFLSTEEITELLKHAEEHAYKPYVHPMLLAAAHTGARRSELIRSQAEDIDFKAKVITIRERKRERGHHGTRSVPMSPLLAKTLKKWLAGRTGGPTFYATEVTTLTRSEAHTHLELTLAKSKWDKIKGWHCLRHSFASNCAARGLDQRIIDSWMGHQSEEMRKRYAHSFPDQHQNAMQSVFG